MKDARRITIDENTRLDLRQEFERLMGARLADVAMEAMPPLDYDNFATKQDVANLGIELRGEIAGVRGEIAGVRGEISEVRGEISEMRGDFRSALANQLRIIAMMQVGTIVAMTGVMSQLV